MTRLIDADILLQGYEDHDFIDTHVIWNAPTVDAVPVIRCKDCKHYEANKGYMWGTCGVNIHDVDETDWCRWAERRTE